MKKLGFTRQSAVDADLRATASDIYDLTNAILTLQETGGSVTTDGNEQNIYIVDGPLGVFRPVCVFVNLDLMVGGDTTVFRVYYRIAPGGAQYLADYQSYTGIDGSLANGKKLIVIDLYPTRFGVRVTIQRTAGGDRAYTWEVFEEA